MRAAVKRSHFWVGGGISAVALFLAFRQVDAGKMANALAQADYWLIAAAAGLQLLVIGAIAHRLHPDEWTVEAKRVAQGDDEDQ